MCRLDIVYVETKIYHTIYAATIEDAGQAVKGFLFAYCKMFCHNGHYVLKYKKCYKTIFNEQRLDKTYYLHMRKARAQIGFAPHRGDSKRYTQPIIQHTL